MMLAITVALIRSLSPAGLLLPKYVCVLPAMQYSGGQTNHAQGTVLPCYM